LARPSSDGGIVPERLL